MHIYVLSLGVHFNLIVVPTLNRTRYLNGTHQSHVKLFSMEPKTVQSVFCQQ